MSNDFDPTELIRHLARQEGRIRDLEIAAQQAATSQPNYHASTATSFNSDMGANTLQIRSDTNTLHINDGTYNLGTTPVPLAFVPYSSFTFPLTAGATYNYIAALPGTVKFYDFWAHTCVNTTNNSLNYWMVNVKTQSSTTIASFNTSADTAGAFTIKNPTLTNSVIAGSQGSVIIAISASGSPGTFEFRHQLFYQRTFS